MRTGGLRTRAALVGLQVRYFGFNLENPLEFRLGWIVGMNGANVNVRVMADPIFDCLNCGRPESFNALDVELVNADPVKPTLGGKVCVVVE